MSNKDFIVDLTETRLFSGLYNSIWMNDETLDFESDELSEKLSKRYNRQINIDFSISFKEYLEQIANVYMNFFENEISNSKWELERVYSPKEYNFDTDHIILKWFNAPKNAEERFNNFLKQINPGYNDYNPYGDIENYTIFDSYQGYEIINELAEFHDWDRNPITYNDKYEPIIEKFEVKDDK